MSAPAATLNPETPTLYISHDIRALATSPEEPWGVVEGLETNAADIHSVVQLACFKRLHVGAIALTAPWEIQRFTSYWELPRDTSPADINIGRQEPHRFSDLRAQARERDMDVLGVRRAQPFTGQLARGVYRAADTYRGRRGHKPHVYEVGGALGGTGLGFAVPIIELMGTANDLYTPATGWWTLGGLVTGTALLNPAVKYGHRRFDRDRVESLRPITVHRFTS